VNRTVVITGGGTGMGKAMAGAFAADGDAVVILGRRQGPLERTAQEIGRRISWRVCDVSQPNQLEEFASWLTVAVASTVDVLINNAGGVSSVDEAASLEKAAEYAWDTLSANLVGAYLMTRALLPRLRRPGGRIVNISSIAAFRGGGDMYSAAKAGLVGLTYSLAQELGPDGITVNAIAPGMVLGTEFFGDRMTDERRERTVGQTPMRRPGTSEDVAAAALYLASDAASFVTGEVLHVNGGWTFGR
jgi:3-oxoacyl-[acyl-carrier protein] reductase